MTHRLLILFTAVALVFCGLEAFADNTGIPSANVYVSSKTLPAGLKRVLVLPLAWEKLDDNNGNLSGGCLMLDPVLQAELTKAGRFEVIVATPETLRSTTGRMSWNGSEALPANFFDSLKNVYACDAVMFCQLSTFRPDAPLAVGWRLKLADAGTGNILWATDEIFDAGNLDVARDAEQWEKSRQPHHNFMFNVFSFLSWCVDTPTRSALDDQWKVLHSPRVFGEYSLDNLLKTLPQR
jgi:hypothetical protein